MQPYQKNSSTSILPSSTASGALTSLYRYLPPWAPAKAGRKAQVMRRSDSSLFMAGSLLFLDFDQAGVDSVLRQRLAYLVDLVHLLVRPQAHPVPRALVRQVGRLDARLEAENREARLLVVGVGRVLERPRLDEINVLRRILLTGRLALRRLEAIAQLLLRHRLLGPGQDLIEVELRLLRAAGGRRGGALRGQAGDRRRLAGRHRLLVLRLRHRERHRRAVQVERHPDRDRDADQQADEDAEHEAALRALARRGHVPGSGHHIFSGALTPSSDRPLASVWRTAAHSASRAARSASSSTRMRSAL